MLKNVFKKFILTPIAAVIAAAIPLSATLVSGCTLETDHPVVRITAEFSDKSYDLEYTLYRNMYPNTVRRFIELAAAGYYDGMIVHDYRAGQDWVSGMYSCNNGEYAEAVSTSSANDYLDLHDKESEFLKLFDEKRLSVSVYANQRFDDGDNAFVSAEEALPTLIGEFKSNIQQQIDKGALDDELGVLKMIYYSKDTEQKVYVKSTSDQTIMADYKNNAATTAFAMQVGNSTAYGDSGYCVFGKIKNLSDLQSLVTDVEEVLADNTPTTVSVSGVNVDPLTDRRFSESYPNANISLVTTGNFTLPAIPIKLTVKVVSY